MTSARRIGDVIFSHRKAIIFLTVALCLAGAHSARTLPTSVFPQTNFPRVVILIDNGVMPVDEMMATVTRPVEEAMRNIQGVQTIRSSTSRGSAEVNVFFDWSTDMIQSELYVLGRLSQIRSGLPPQASFAVHRLTFKAFPIFGISLTSRRRSVTELWTQARYELSPRLLALEGVARINVVGGSRPEFHVVIDPAELAARHLTLDEISQAIGNANVVVSAGMREEDRQLYLTTVDNRFRNKEEIEDAVVAWVSGSAVRIRDIGSVRPGSEPRYNVVTADGRDAVLLNVYGQPGSDTLGIAESLRGELKKFKEELPPDMRLAFFYDQSQFVEEGVASVWESIFAGLALAALVLFVFLRRIGPTIVATAVIPVTVLLTILGLRAVGMSFNLMTLGGIAAAIGMVIDDAIVIVEAIHSWVSSGLDAAQASTRAIQEVGLPLIGSTLTPVVVFIPLAFLDGVPGVFFRALALTMVFALLGSLLLALTWTPAIASLLMRPPRIARPDGAHGGFLLRGVVALYENAVRRALRYWIVTVLCIAAAFFGGVVLYGRLESDFLPAQDEGAFVLDYFTRPGTSLTETDRILRHVENILLATPEVESFSRRTGARLALAIGEPNTGDFLVKLKARRSASTSDVIDRLRAEIHRAEPALQTEFPGVLSDLIGDLTWSPDPVEIKIFSSDVGVLKKKAAEIAEMIEEMPGVVDVNNGLVVAGPTFSLHVHGAAAARLGLTPRAVGGSLRTALLGEPVSHVLEGDRALPIRVLLDRSTVATSKDLSTMLLGTPGKSRSALTDVATTQVRPGILEMHRENLRQLVAVSARFSGIDLGHGIARIQSRLAKDLELPPDARLEFGGLFKQQQDSFRNLGLVLAAAILLVYGVLLLEFRSFQKALAIVLGSVLALMGVVGALAATHTSVNIVSLLGAIIGVGIVAKNGILMLDNVAKLEGEGVELQEALVRSGRRRLRPVLMTSLTTVLGLLPLAWGVGAGADMLRPMAIAIIGSLVVSLLLSLVATPVFYYVMVRSTTVARRWFHR